mmetsp:Transcript_29573/g.34302  ORF Transcript_29573/g.34302 Transcript_29573/m.34302 type:complete len:298 (-) Transcript_29573:13-906(-)
MINTNKVACRARIFFNMVTLAFICLVRVQGFSISTQLSTSSSNSNSLLLRQNSYRHNHIQQINNRMTPYNSYSHVFKQHQLYNTPDDENRNTPQEDQTATTSATTTTTQNKLSNDTPSSSTSTVVERLNLESQFHRWRVLQNILEEEDEKISPSDINEILYIVFKSFLDHPRSLTLEDGVTSNKSPILDEKQCEILRNDLLKVNDVSGVGSIYAIPVRVPGDDYNDELIVKNNLLLEMFQPDPVEHEEAFKSCWDLVVEMYGRESTKIAQRDATSSWQARSSIVRLLIHFDFLTEGI